MQVHIRFHCNKTITCDIQPSDTVKHLKLNIQQQAELGCAQKRLMFAGNELRDDSILAEYNVENNSTLHFIPKQEDMLIFIKMFHGKILAFDVDSHGTIEEIKFKIHEKEGSPIWDQRLFTPKGLLENPRTLVSYGLKDEQLIYQSIKFWG